jgi:RNA polymerase sigma-70 factor (ECF subfamily)
LAAAPDPTERFYAELWPHRAAVLRTARVLTHSDADSDADADDLAQETMLKAFRAIDRLARGSNPKAWLMTILRNTHVDRLRARPPAEVSLDADLVAETEADPPADWGDAEQVLASFSDEQVIAALRALPPDIRWTLLLADVQGMDDAEAAQVLAVPEGTIKSRLHRGRRMLRTALAGLRR